MGVDQTPLEDLPLFWSLDVCATCGRKATWPFCEHRREDRRWTVAVYVKPANLNTYRTRILQAREAGYAKEGES